MSSNKQYQGKYKQLEMIGKGRYGTIYHIISIQDNKQYVAKHIPLDQIEEGVAHKQLQIIKQLRHPYIVEYIDNFTSSTDFIIIMEYCKQKDLDHHIQLMRSRNKHFNENLVITWLFQLVLAIQFIHTKKVLHRDIKPQNVFIDDKLNVKIGDFGISKILASTEQHCATMTGTPYYLAPEIIHQQLYTTKADIWSLGCVIYQICCLEKPFSSNGGILKLMDQIKTAEIKPIPKIYSQDLRKLIIKMLTRDQAKRPNTTQLLKDPVLVDLMIKSSSSMSLRHQYSKGIDKPLTLSDTFIDKQTNFVHEQLRKFQKQVQSKMKGLKKKQLANNQIDEQYMELKKKMGEIEKAIGKAFDELKKRADGNGVESQEMKTSETENNLSNFSDSSEMTLLQSVEIDQKPHKNKETKIISGSATYESIPIISARNNIKQNYLQNSSIISTESMLWRQTIDQRQNEKSSLGSLVITSRKEEQSLDQTLKSQYQKTQKTNTIAKQTLDRLDFLQKALSRNPDSVLNGSLLSYTLTMSQDEIKKSMRLAQKQNTLNTKLKNNNNMDDTINLDLSKRSSDSLRYDKAFSRKKVQTSNAETKKQIYENQQMTISKVGDEQDEQLGDEYEEDFEDYSEDDEEQGNSSSSPSGAQLMKQKRKNQLNTIKSFYQQTLLQINNQSEYPNEIMTHSQKLKNKYPLLMSEIKEQIGEAGSILSKKNSSADSKSSFGL